MAKAKAAKKAKPNPRNKKLYDDGMKMRKAVLGASYVDNSMANAATDDFMMSFQDITTEYAWGYVWTRPGLPKNGQNSYLAISGGYLQPALHHVTGQSTNTYLATKKVNNFTTFVAAYNAGEAIAFGTKPKPPNRSIVGGHAYSVVGYNASTQRGTLYNPWGPEYGTITLRWSEIQANMPYFSCTA
jgi:hypothetical protein